MIDVILVTGCIAVLCTLSPARPPSAASLSFIMAAIEGEPSPRGGRDVGGHWVHAAEGASEVATAEASAVALAEASAGYQVQWFEFKLLQTFGLQLSQDSDGVPGCLQKASDRRCSHACRLLLLMKAECCKTSAVCTRASRSRSKCAAAGDCSLHKWRARFAAGALSLSSR